jgi:hypothetical protein
LADMAIPGLVAEMSQHYRGGSVKRTSELSGR